MNFIFESTYPHASRGVIIQPLHCPKSPCLLTKDELKTLLCSHWPLQDINFHVRLDQAISQWQTIFFKEMKIVESKNVLECSEADFS